jgi:hypothetical protein
MENNQIASTIQKLGIGSLYGNKSSYPKNNAQLNLAGRSHFAEDSTLRYFGSRINSAHETESGLLFYIVESSFLNYDKTERGFRYAIFDIFGTSVARLPVEDALKTSEQARKAMWKELETFDTAEHYKKALDSIAKKADREASQAREAIAQLAEEALA